MPDAYNKFVSLVKIHIINNLYFWFYHEFNDNLQFVCM